MLRSLRKVAHTWIFKLLFILLIASFGVWGIGDMVRRIGPGEELAKVGGVDISREMVDRDFRRTVEQLRRQTGGSFSTEQAVKMGMPDRVVQQLVQRTLMRLSATDTGIRVGDDVVRARIAQEQAFRNQAGVFDPQVFRSVLQQSGYSEDGFIALLRDDVARQLLSNAVTSGAGAPKALTDALFAFRGERRTFEVLTLDAKSAGDVGTPDDKMLETYYQEHPIPFTAPEYRAMTVIQVLLDDLAKDVKVSDGDIQQAYDERRSEFVTLERRKVRMAVTDDEKKADALATAARSKGIDAAAKDAGVSAVNLGEVTEKDIPEIGKAIFALADGEKGAVVKSAFGWHVVAVEGVLPGSVKPLTDVREMLAKAVARERAADRLADFSNQIDDRLASGMPLAEVAKTLGLRVVTLGAVDAAGKGPDGKPATTGLIGADKVLATGFGLAPNATSPLVDVPTGDMFAVHLDTITPPALRPFAEVRAQVADAWVAEKRAAATAEKAKKLAEQLKTAGADGAGQLAKSFGAAYTVTAPMARDGTADVAIPPEVSDQLFAGVVGAVATGDVGDAQVVARVKEILPADAAAQATELAAVGKSAEQGMENDLLTQYIGSLQRRYPVTVHHDRIARMYAQTN